MTLIELGAFGRPSQTFGTIPQGLNQGGTQQNFVPDGDVWEIHAASVGQLTAGTYADVRLSFHIEYDLGAQGVHLFALTPMAVATHGTPFLTLPRRVILMPHMRLGVRFNDPPADLEVSLMAYGFSYPIAQLDRLLLSGSGVPPPDLSALVEALGPAVTALTGAATALQGVAASVAP